MKNLGRNLINILIGMVIAIFLIAALLWFLNRAFFEHPPLQKDVNPRNQETEHAHINVANLSPGLSETDSNFDDSSANDEGKIDSNDPIGAVIDQSVSSRESETPLASKAENNSAQINRPSTASKPANRTQTFVETKEKSRSAKKLDHSDDKLGNLIAHLGKKDLERKKAEGLEAARQNGKNYHLQIGSFQTSGEAQNRKAKLHTLGIASEIQQIQVKGQTYYRVLSIKNYDKNSADAYALQLKGKGIDSLLLPQSNH